MFVETRIKNGTAPEPGKGLRLAVYQVQAGLSGSQQAIAKNLETLKSGATVAKEYQAQLISFPELFLCGYAFEDTASAYAICLSVDEATAMIAPIAEEIGIAILCPYPEKAEVDGTLCYYDSMILINEKGEVLKNYRKTHLWGPGEQALWSFGYASPSEGDAFTVERINDFPIGLLNCYEAEFPELSRTLALKGAQLVVIPTAADLNSVILGKWSNETYPDISKNIIPTNALQNIMFVAYNNYTGTGYIVKKDGTQEDQVIYSGNSVIADPHGEIMVAARANDEVLLISDCIPDDYKNTHPCGTNYIKDRRPSLYNELISEEINRYEYSYPLPPNPIYTKE